MDLGLKGAKVLVTGASQGLGAATARRFSLEGALVVISSRNLGKLQATAKAINEESGNPVYTHAADVTDPDSVGKLIENTVSSLGGLDILVTNAGGPAGGKFESFDFEAWQKGTELTFLSAVNLVRHALPHLKKSERAAVLAITSRTVKEPIMNLTMSNVLRAPVTAMMKTLSREHGADGIRFNSILPGWTLTERVDYLMNNFAEANKITVEEQIQKVTTNIPLGRMGDPEEFANAAAFLCSPAGGFINGTTLLVDGGETMSIF
jgi:3-oxoacyl-[acyl-carrier protein] reductase